jgi:hypothetical protein
MCRVILRFTPFHTCIVCSQAKYVKSSTENRSGEDVFDLASCWTDHDRQSCWHSKQSALEEVEEAEEHKPEPQKRTMTVSCWLRGLDTLTLASSCLRTLTGTDSEQQQLGKKVRGFLFALRRFRRKKRTRRRLPCLVGFDCLISSSRLPRLVHLYLYCWT